MAADELGNHATSSLEARDGTTASTAKNAAEGPAQASGRPAGHASRRDVLGGAAAVAVASVLLPSKDAAAAAAPDPGPSMAAVPPAGFVPFSAPGKVVKVTKAGSLQANQIYPKPEDAELMLTRVLTELTGKPDLLTALAEFIHKDDKVVVKVNGIALRNMSTNKELVLPLLNGLIQMGVPATNITVLEQYGSFLDGTRINARNVPAGVNVAVHGNGNATMAERMIPGTGVRTKFTRFLTEATACINFALIKDHSICGYTGAMKNMTHGCSINPHDFHVHHASPQIAMLYAQDVIKSRVRLNIADAYKVTCHGGPLDKQPQYRLPYESVMASTDAVAIDAVGWEIVEGFRKAKGLKTLTAEGRPPAYIKAAGDLGLGIADRSQIDFKEVTI